MTVLRFLGSFAAALAIVGSLLAIGAKLFSAFDGQDVGLVFHEIDLLSQRDRPELADILGTGPRPGPLPPMSAIPPLEFRRTLRGFVQLEVSIGTDGQVQGAHVLGSTLPPDYDRRAVDLVRARRYPPELVNGQPVAVRRLEIVDFRMDAPAMGSDPQSVDLPR